MFYYLSFLRPPPTATSLSGAVSFTPQIANDLRTELLEHEKDIYYTWIEHVSGSPGTAIDAFGSAASLPATPKPQKLTVWRPSGAYRELKVPPPPRVREGQCWRLVLTLDAATSPVISLSSGEKCGIGPFPVISMPVMFTSKISRMNSKQERIERLYSLGVPRPQHNADSDQKDLVLRVTEQTSFDLDKKIWDSGIGLSSWLTAFHNSSVDSALSDLHNALFSENTRHILELGAGTGIVSLVLAALRSSSLAPDANGTNIITTDLPSAMSLLEHNIAANMQLFSTAPPQAAVLDWDDSELPECVHTAGGPDVIIMADVTYNTAAFPSLVRTLGTLLHLGPKPPLVLLGYKERDAAERTLWELVSDIGLDLQRVGERGGAGGPPVEIWLGYVQTRDGT